MAVPETPEQMETRLLRVIAQSQFDVLSNDYTWQPMPPGQPPAREAIACVCDGDVWHQFAAPLPTLRRSGIESSAFISRKALTLPGSSHGWLGI